MNILLGQSYNFCFHDFRVTVIIPARKPFHVLYFLNSEKSGYPGIFFEGKKNQKQKALEPAKISVVDPFKLDSDRILDYACEKNLSGQILGQIRIRFRINNNQGPEQST